MGFDVGKYSDKLLVNNSEISVIFTCSSSHYWDSKTVGGYYIKPSSIHVKVPKYKN